MTIDSALPAPERQIFCNRTLNLRSIKAVGFDMDYTLIHYEVSQWEEHAYDHLKNRLAARGWPVSNLRFDESRVALGLVLDLAHGNIVKANRFGYIKRAVHGTRLLDYEEQKRLYSGDLVDLGEPRWVFLNTLFSLSEACMYGQIVDLLDDGKLPEVLGYDGVYRVVRQSLDQAHIEGQLKAEIIADPDRFVVLDPELPLALADLKHAGKKLILITNSEWSYTNAMMTYAFDRFLPDGTRWRDLFDMRIVSARKPSFFEHRGPWFEVIDDEGRLLPATAPREGGSYLGGNASGVEQALGLSGDEILYVGDHIFSDVRKSRSLLRWRTALVIRELENELRALHSFREDQESLTRMMAAKEELEHRYSAYRVALQRKEAGYGPQCEDDIEELRSTMSDIREELVELDSRISPLAKTASELVNPTWGLLLRTGNDKSHLARQIERFADVYTSRVSNFLVATPFVYLRSPRGSLPHDHGPGGGAA